MKWSRAQHWVSQVGPPIPLVLVYSPHGPGFWFLLGIPLLCLVISAITLILKVISYNKNKDRLLRPILTIVISGTLFEVASHSYSIAKAQAESIFNEINGMCKTEMKCPSTLSGWDELEPGKRYRTNVGNYITYPLTYNNSSKTFTLYLYQSLDMGKNYEGGVN